MKKTREIGGFGICFKISLYQTSFFSVFVLGGERERERDLSDSDIKRDTCC
jgi:hypothetical protein